MYIFQNLLLMVCLSKAKLMKIKLIPKHEQDLSKVFIFLLPLVVVLSALLNFLKEVFRSFANVLPGNQILNYGLLDKISNQVTYNFLFSFNYYYYLE